MPNQFPHPFGELARKYRAMRTALPAKISNLALNEFKENFVRKGYRNNGGVVIPWRSTKKRKNQFGKSSKGILVQSGRLKRSLKAMSDYNYARVVSDVPYAKIHNEGGVIHGKQQVRAFTRKNKSKKKPTSKVKAHSRKVNTKIPKRQFMGHTQALNKDIQNLVDSELKKLFK